MRVCACNLTKWFLYSNVMTNMMNNLCVLGVSHRHRLGRPLPMTTARRETTSTRMTISTQAPALAVSVCVCVCVCECYALTPWFFQTRQLLCFNLLTLKTPPPLLCPRVMVTLVARLTRIEPTHTQPHNTNHLAQLTVLVQIY